jgi:hypothetical protein
MRRSAVTTTVSTPPLFAFAEFDDAAVCAWTDPQHTSAKTDVDKLSLSFMYPSLRPKAPHRALRRVGKGSQAQVPSSILIDTSVSIDIVRCQFATPRTRTSQRHACPKLAAQARQTSIFWISCGPDSDRWL